MYKQSGLTILELLVVIAIVAIVVTVGAPSVMDAQRTLRFKGAVESGYFTLLAARNQSISSGIDHTVSFSAGTAWCIGSSDAGDCDCTAPDSCLVDGVESVLRGSEFPQTTLESVDFGGNTFTQFDSQRGLAMGNAGSFIISDGDADAQVTVNTMGRVSICMAAGQLGSYAAC